MPVLKKPEPDPEPAPVTSRASLVTAVGSMGHTVTPTTKPEVPNQPHAKAVALPPPEAHTILLWSEGDVLSPISVFGSPHAREIMVDGVPYDHVDTDSEGTWIYRNDRKN